MQIYDSVLDTVGNTPLIRLSRIEKSLGLNAELIAKTESRNPGGSAKDRVALEMIRQAECDGRLKPGGTIIEATSGNTGVGLALAATVLGYHVVLTMPETMSLERRKLLAGFGAELVLTAGSEGMAGANRKAEELLNNTPNSIRAFQFENEANPNAHEKTTGVEIWRDTDGTVDAFVATAGTCGTLVGTARYLKKQNPLITVIGVEPTESPLISQGHTGRHDIQGIGANFVPAVYDASVVDRVVTVSTEEAYITARQLMRTEGILCGISSGAAIAAAIELARQPEMAGKRIVAILPDTGERYLSTKLFD